MSIKKVRIEKLEVSQESCYNLRNNGKEGWIGCWRIHWRKN